MKNMKVSIALFTVFLTLSLSSFSQDEVLDKLKQKDSVRSKKTEKLFKSNVVTTEVHNVLFRNIYRSRSNNEEEEFKREIARLQPFDNKIIDTVVFEQINSFGESVYDTSIKSNQFEKFLSTKLHVNTKKKIIRNRYLILTEGTIFSPYRAYENARLMRSSGIFHDVRILPRIKDGDSNHVVLIYRIQDVFPYGLSLGVNDVNDFSFGIENINIAGLNHRLSTDFRINGNDISQVFGMGAKYTIPNIINKSFIDGYLQGRHYSNDKSIELGVSRGFVRPEFRWAGGDIFAYRDKGFLNSSGNLEYAKFVENDLWLSHSFPFRSYNTTVNALIGGVGHTFRKYIERPATNPSEPFLYSNTNLILSSLGYSRVKFIQDRLLNGFGRTEDIPIGLSVNGLFGIDYNEFITRNYYGLEVLAQYHTGKGYYVNINTRYGIFASKNGPSQGVFDFNFQNVSTSYKLGNFRLRNFLRMRATLGINQDKNIFLTEANGIRGIVNSDFQGRNRFTAGFQSNLFVPLSIAGFRFSVFGLVEIAKIQPSFDDFFNTPALSGLTAGLAIKNENLIFDVIQIQYGYYPSTSSLSQRGLVISSILPIHFQRLDISRPRLVVYE